MPSAQSIFKQYLHIFLVIALYVCDTLSTIKRRLPSIEIASMISPLVLVLSLNKARNPFCSRTDIGFSACGGGGKDILNDYKGIILELGDVKLRHASEPRNCSEVGNLCHLDEFVSLGRRN